MANRTYLGYEALVRRYRLRVPPLPCAHAATDRALRSRTSNASRSELIELHRTRVRDTATIAGQLTFAFKREHLNLAVLGALFEVPEALEAVQTWHADKPTSTYARMAGHLATWLTGHNFDFSLPAGAPRVPLLDPQQCVVGPARPDLKFGVVKQPHR